MTAAEAAPAQSRLGMNLSGIVDWNTEHPFVDVFRRGIVDWNTEHPFVDVFRLSRQWISQRQGQPWGKGPQLELDEHGCVKKLEPDCFAETPILTGGHAPDGDYVCLYNGDGQVEFGANSKVIERAPGRLVVTIEGRKAGTFLSIRKTNPENPVRNIRLLMPGMEQSYRTEPFSTAFLNRWRGFNTLRFMDWMDIYSKYLDAWRGVGGDLMCIFSSVATSSKWGSWGLLEGADETVSPKFDAVVKWNLANPR